MAKKTQIRLYKVVNHISGAERLVSAYNRWQAMEFVARDNYSAEVVTGSEAMLLAERGLKVEHAVKVARNDD